MLQKLKSVAQTISQFHAQLKKTGVVIKSAMRECGVKRLPQHRGVFSDVARTLFRKENKSSPAAVIVTAKQHRYT
ncbi:hypothetical protein pEaSNUABM29_00243 [Erwinia phage pEa_SNUABM_29]|nr:hypothetical protein pEaSNUABM29_00243 [Erwinia phage pEa_SNUABM_29]